MAAPIGITFISKTINRFNIRTFIRVYPIRSYVKPLIRKPIRVLSQEDANKLMKKHGKMSNRKSNVKPFNSVDRQPQLGFENAENNIEAANRNFGHKNGDNSSENRFELPVNVKYEKLYEGDKRFGPVVLNAKVSNDRDKNPMILLEGKRLILEAINASIQIKTIYFTHNELLEGFPLEKLTASGLKLFKVKPKQMDIWSDTVTPMGIMAICKKPKDSRTSKEKRLPIIVICDKITDPGILGTVIRSAAAASVEKILVTRASVDPWQPKVLRAGAGAHFYVPLIDVNWESIPGYMTENSQIYIVGTQELAATENHVKELPKAVLEEISAEFEDKDSSVQRTTKEKRKLANLCESIHLPVSSYDSIDYTDQDVVLVIGNDERPSSDARKLAFNVGGTITYVPTANCDHKLHAAVSASVLLFEIKRQLLKVENSRTLNDSENLAK